MRIKDMLRYHALYAPDDGSSGGGDDGDTGDTTADAGQTPQYVTQEAMAEQFKGLQDGLFSMVRKMIPQKTESPNTPAPTKSEAKPDGQQMADLQAQIDFLKGAPKGLSQDAQDAMFDLYRAQKPDDPAEWFASKSKLFAMEPTVKPEAKPNQQSPAVDAATPKATDAHEVDANDVTQWSAEDYARQFSLKAKVPHNRYDVRNREFYREIRRSAERKMAQTRIQLGGRKDS